MVRLLGHVHPTLRMHKLDPCPAVACHARTAAGKPGFPGSPVRVKSNSSAGGGGSVGFGRSVVTSGGSSYGNGGGSEPGDITLSLRGDPVKHVTSPKSVRAAGSRTTLHAPESSTTPVNSSAPRFNSQTPATVDCGDGEGVSAAASGGGGGGSDSPKHGTMPLIAPPAQAHVAHVPTTSASRAFERVPPISSGVDDEAPSRSRSAGQTATSSVSVAADVVVTGGLKTAPLGKRRRMGEPPPPDEASPPSPKLTPAVSDTANAAAVASRTRAPSPSPVKSNRGGLGGGKTLLSRSADMAGLSGGSALAVFARQSPAKARSASVDRASQRGRGGLVGQRSSAAATGEEKEALDGGGGGATGAGSAKATGVVTAVQRVAEYRKKVQNLKVNRDGCGTYQFADGGSGGRRRGSDVDLEEMRRQADLRVEKLRREAAERSRKVIEEAAKKRNAVSEKRAAEVRAKQQRRAEIYALNAIMSEIARRQFERICEERACEASADVTAEITSGSAAESETSVYGTWGREGSEGTAGVEEAKAVRVAKVVASMNKGLSGSPPAAVLATSSEPTEAASVAEVIDTSDSDDDAGS